MAHVETDNTGREEVNESMVMYVPRQTIDINPIRMLTMITVPDVVTQTKLPD
jgi:hypothetical protein